MKQIIHIFGASGAGTSTLGRAFCEKSGYFFMDTDDYFWLPTDPKFTVKREKSERIALMKRDIEAHENVVISGSLSGWGDELIPLFTLAVRLVTDTETRIKRLKSRERERFGSRIEAGGDMYDTHTAFIEWAGRYDNGGADMRSHAMHDEWQKLLKCKIITLDGSKDIVYNVTEIDRAYPRGNEWVIT